MGKQANTHIEQFEPLILSMRAAGMTGQDYQFGEVLCHEENDRRGTGLLCVIIQVN